MSKNSYLKKKIDSAIQNHKTNNFKAAEKLYKKILKINPNHLNSIFLLATLYCQIKNFDKAKPLLQRVVEISPNHVDAHNNLGNSFNALGDCQNAIKYLEKAIELNPNYGTAYNSLGVVLIDSGDKIRGKNCFEKAIELNPNSIAAIWNLHQFSSNTEEALTILKKIIDIDKNYIRAKAIISAIEGYKGDFNNFEVLMNSHESTHPYIRSIKWVFSLSKLPKLFFSRWDFFDEIIKLTDQSRPFYEFGVWNGVSFQYLIHKYKRGFGFDTFTGLPESWREIAAGTYSSLGSIPKIKGGNFIAGKFEDTFPDFFSIKRPIASLINFDADLYSSTLCALNNTKNIMDEKTILIFDEFLINTKWEEDEFKALNEFCNNFNFSYNVLAVSFFSKQVAVQINKVKNLS